eukprot:EG_transcript_14042
MFNLGSWDRRAPVWATAGTCATGDGRFDSLGLLRELGVRAVPNGAGAGAVPGDSVAEAAGVAARCVMLADAQLAQGVVQDAVRWYTASLRIDPSEALFTARAGALLRLGQALLALEDAASATDLNPRNVLAWQTVCLALEMLQQPHLARMALTSALELLPDAGELLELRQRLPPLQLHPSIIPANLNALGESIDPSRVPDPRLLCNFSQADTAFEVTSFPSAWLRCPPMPPAAQPLPAAWRVNAVVEAREGPHGRGLFAGSDIDAFRVVLEEAPVLAAHTAAGHCDHCTGPLPPGTHPQQRRALPCPDCRQAFYCSAECRQAADVQGHRLL